VLPSKEDPSSWLRWGRINLAVKVSVLFYGASLNLVYPLVGDMRQKR
jgi:hypothetical protein